MNAIMITIRKSLPTSITAPAIASTALGGRPGLACVKPETGTYQLGWDSARFIGSTAGRPDQAFRGENTIHQGHTPCLVTTSPSQEWSPTAKPSLTHPAHVVMQLERVARLTEPQGPAEIDGETALTPNCSGVLP